MKKELVLNDEQRRLVEENVDLIEKYAESLKAALYDVEDWYGYCAELLCVAAIDYDKTYEEHQGKNNTKENVHLNKDSEYSRRFRRYAESELNRIRGKLPIRRYMESEEGLIDSPMGYSIDRVEIDKCLDMPDPHDFTEDVDIRDAVSRVKAGMNGTERLVVESVYEQGYSVKEVAAMYPLTVDEVVEICEMFRQRMKECCLAD